MLGAAAGTSAALAQPLSRPRRVPGGPVAGDWEPSPAGPRAGAVWEREALAAVARRFGQRPPRRPSWALGPGALWLEPGPASGHLGTRRGEESGSNNGSHLRTAPAEAREGGMGARVMSRLHRQKEAEGNHPVGLSRRNRQFWIKTWVQGWPR